MEELKANIIRIFNSCKSISLTLVNKLTHGLAYGQKGISFVLLLLIIPALVITSFTVIVLSSIGELILEEGYYTAKEVIKMKENLYAVS
jgi:hypothetical protein